MRFLNILKQILYQSFCLEKSLARVNNISILERLARSNKTVTNIRNHFQIKRPVWFQELLKKQ